MICEVKQFFLDMIFVSNLNYLTGMFLDTGGALFMPEGLSINVCIFGKFA